MSNSFRRKGNNTLLCITVDPTSSRVTTEEAAATVEVITTIDTTATIEVQVRILGIGIEIEIEIGFKNWAVTGLCTLKLWTTI